MHMCIKRTHANDLHGKKSHCGKEEEVLEVVFLSSMHIYLYAFPARNSAAKQPVKGGSSGGGRVWPV